MIRELNDSASLKQSYASNGCLLPVEALASNATFPVERVDFVLLPSRRNFGGTCDEDGNWRIVCAPPRTDNARTRPQGRVVVRELVIPSAPEHFDYLGQDGGCRSIHSA